jgi:hypothetical protein
MLNVNQRVAKFSNNNEYFTGTITKLESDKALVLFDSRGFSRWCNLSNLKELN